MKVILLKQFHINIIKSNKVYLYYKIMEKFLTIFILYLIYINVFNKAVKMILLSH